MGKNISWKTVALGVASGLIIGLMVAVFSPRLTTRSPRLGPQMKVYNTVGILKGMEEALSDLETAVSRYPTTTETLSALVVKPASWPEEEWRWPFLKELPKDSYDQDLVYYHPGRKGQTYELFSKGPDKLADTSDDIYTTSSWRSLPRSPR